MIAQLILLFLYLTVNYNAYIKQNLTNRSLTDDSALQSVEFFRDRLGFHGDHVDNNPIYDHLQQ